MPRSEDVLSIFLASPSDVSAERARLGEVVADWNRAWSRNLGLRLELLCWENDAYPDIGEDAQAIINEQIPQDWDLFIGIMWSRFGTPTGRAGSGTEEEFQRAISRHKAAPGSVSVMLYFKDAAIAPSKMDLAQMSQVQAFKATIQSHGLLTWDFVDTDQFEKLIELHITRHVQEWRKSKEALPMAMGPSPSANTITPVTTSPVTSSLSTVESPEDLGYLDLLEEFTERSAEMGAIATRIALAQQELTDQTNKGRAELNALQADPSNSAKKFRASIARVADEMLRFTEKVETEVPLFRTAVDSSMGALIRLATLVADIYPERMASTKASAVQLLATLIEARQSTEGFRDSTATLPRMTKELNVAKRLQVAALNSLIAEFENGERLLTEGLSVIDGLSGSGPTQ